MNSEQPWLPTQDQASQHSNMEEGDSQVPPLAKELLTVDVSGRRGSFLDWCRPWALFCFVLKEGPTR